MRLFNLNYHSIITTRSHGDELPTGTICANQFKPGATMVSRFLDVIDNLSQILGDLRNSVVRYSGQGFFAAAFSPSFARSQPIQTASFMYASAYW